MATTTTTTTTRLSRKAIQLTNQNRTGVAYRDPLVEIETDRGVEEEERRRDTVAQDPDPSRDRVDIDTEDPDREAAANATPNDSIRDPDREALVNATPNDPDRDPDPDPDREEEIIDDLEVDREIENVDREESQFKSVQKYFIYNLTMNEFKKKEKKMFFFRIKMNQM